MSARWPEWFRKVGDTATHPAALNIGKKLLGYLATRRESPGVQTLVKRVTLDDGTVVEARFDGDQPRVTVYAVGGEQAACELYVESGLLDLGPNIAPDAGKRFNRGPPQFDDRPATLYFGTGVGCSDSSPGLNGKIKIDLASRHVTSECLPSQGGGIQSRLTDPKKKQAQALLPASCWSGLMQRYVQAVYGGDSLEYSGTPTALTIEGVTIQIAESWGLLDMQGILRFVNISDSGSAAFYEVKPKSSCFVAALKLWRYLRSVNDYASADKVLTVALSGCKIGEFISTVDSLPEGNRHFKKRAAWVFSRDGSKAVAVLESGGVASIYEATFITNDTENVSVSIAVRDSAAAFNGSSWRLIVGDASPWSKGGAGESGIKGKETKDGLAEGDSFDFPVFAYYEGEEVKAIRFCIFAGERVIPNISHCMRDGNSFGYDSSGYTHAVTGAVIRVSPSGVDKSEACGGTIKGVVRVVRGYYADRWSSVSVCNAVIQKGDDDLLMPIAGGVEVMGVDSDLIEGSVTRTNTSNDPIDFRFAWCPTGGIFYDNGGECFQKNKRDDFACVSIGDVAVISPNPYPCPASYLESAETTITHEYAPYWMKGGVFLGSMSAGSTPLLCLAFGATDVFVCTEYTFAGGRGGHASVDTWMNTDSANASNSRGSSGISVEQRRCSDTGTAFTVTKTWDIPPPKATGEFLIRLGRINFGPNLVIKRGGSDGGGELVYQKTPLSEVTFHVMPIGARGNESASIIVAGSSANKIDVQRGCAVLSSNSPPGATPFDQSNAGLDACKIYKMVGLCALDDDHIETEFADGAKAWATQSNTKNIWLLEGFAYEGARSLLSAVIEPVPMLERGNSVGMDRQTITGGYPKVNTPSFVGWA